MEHSGLKMRIKSFDIFDTCLSRVCGEPVNVFHLMGSMLTGNPIGSGPCNDYVNARLLAESNARKAAFAAGREEVTIADIFDHFESSAVTCSRQDLVDRELSIEDYVLAPVEGTLSNVNQSREQGYRICFISDMYMPGDFIRGLLAKHGFWKEGDGLYISCECNATKSSGKLFELVCKTEKVPFASIMHTGDHAVSDYQVPKSKGIQSSLFRLSYNRYEYSWISRASFYHHSVQINMLAGLSRSVRTQAPPSAFEHIVGSVVAPLLVPFVAWLIDDARKRGVRKLFFQARDGYVLYRIAQVLLEDEKDISVHYLFGSRRTFYLPGMYKHHHEMVDWVIKGGEGRTPLEMLKRLSLGKDWIQPHLDRLGIETLFLERPMSGLDLQKFREILVDSEVEHALQTEALAARQLVRSYFDQEGLGDGTGTALVDIGWSRVSHQSVNNILDTTKVFGYFLAVFKDRIIGSGSADYAAVFYPEDFAPAEYDRIFDGAYVALLEQFFVMTNDPTTVGYEQTGEGIRPVFGKPSVHAGSFEQYRRMRDETLLSYSRAYRKMGPWLTDHLMLCRACGLASGKIFLKEPDLHELRLLLDFKPDQGSDAGVSLVRHISISTLVKEVFGRWKNGRVSASYLWREGSIKYSFGRTGYAMFRWMQNRKQKEDRAR